MSTNNFEIDLNRFAGYLRYDLSSDITALRLIIKSIDENQYDSLSPYEMKRGMLSTNVPVPSFDFLKQREINKCFKSVMGSIQNYMDLLIAVHRLTQSKLQPPLGCTVSQAQELIQQKFQSILMEVATDTRLTVPKKLDILFEHVPEYLIHKNSIRSLFDIRNGLEHHKGIANKNKALSYLRLGMSDSKGNEVIPPCQLEPGENLNVKAFDEKLEYNEGGNLNLTLYQLEDIFLNITVFSIPALESGGKRLAVRRIE